MSNYLSNRKARICLFLILFFVFFASIFLLITPKNVSAPDAQSISEIPPFSGNKEVIYYKYKYSNNSNIILSTPESVICTWKPDSIDDGLKTCEAVFEVENLNPTSPSVNSPTISFDFKNNNIINQKIEYSDIFTLYNDTYIDIVEDRNGNIIEKDIIITRRKFDKFKAIPLSIDLNKIFAIKITYETSKYSSNSFNFTFSKQGVLDAFIDPIQSSCGTLSTGDSTYTLNQSLSSDAECMVITGNNITLDGNNSVITYRVLGANGIYGIYANGVNNTKIINIKVVDGNSSGGNTANGVYFFNTINSSLSNSSVSVYSNSGVYAVRFGNSINGIVNNSNITVLPYKSSVVSSVVFIISSSSISVINNTIRAYNSTPGVYIINQFSTSNPANISNNIIFTTDGAGIQQTFSADNLILNNNVITTSGSNAYGIDIINVSNSNFINDKITTLGSDALGVNIRSGNSNISFINTIINSSLSNDTQFADGTSGTINFTNVTLKNNRVSFSNNLTNTTYGSLITLNVYWYLDAYSNYTNSSTAGGANISGYNITQGLIFNVLASADGNMPTQNVLGYWRNRTTSVNYNNYTINATNPLGVEVLSQTVNVTTNKKLYFTFSSDPIYPTIIINSPPNNSLVATSYAILNWSVNDNMNNSEVFVWASNDSSNIYDYLVYHKKNVVNGTYTYNFSAKPTRVDSNTILLLHFDNLSAYNENSTNIVDFSGSHLNASASSSLWNDSTRFAGGFEFNGVNTARTISIKDPGTPGFPLDQTQYSASLWFIRRGTGFLGGFANCGTATGIEPLIAKGGGGGDGSGVDASMELGVNGTRLWYCSEDMAGNNQVVGGTTPIVNNVWYHVALVVNATAATTYLNGKVESILQLSAAPATNNITFGIGTLYENTPNTIDGAWNGSIDDVVLWNRTLSYIEVVNLYNLSLGMKYWRVNASDGINMNTSGLYQFNMSSSVVSVYKFLFNQSLSVSDNKTGKANFIRKTPLSNVLNALTIRIGKLFRIISQNISFSALVGRLRKSVITSNQAMVITPNIAKTYYIFKKIPQFMTIQNVVLRTSKLIKVFYNPITISSNINIKFALSRISRQLITISQDSSDALSFKRIVYQTLTITHLGQRIILFSRGFYQSISILLPIQRNIDLSRNIIQTYTFSGVPIATQGLFKVINQAFTITQLGQRIVLISKNFYQDMLILLSLQKNFGVSKGIVQAYTISDASIAEQRLFRVNDQQIVFLDSINRINFAFLGISDIFRLDNSITRTISVIRYTEQLLSFNILTQRIYIIQKSIYDSFAIDANISKQSFLIRIIRQIIRIIADLLVIPPPPKAPGGGSGTYPGNLTSLNIIVPERWYASGNAYGYIDTWDQDENFVYVNILKVTFSVEDIILENITIVNKTISRQVGLYDANGRLYGNKTILLSMPTYRFEVFVSPNISYSKVIIKVIAEQNLRHLENSTNVSIFRFAIPRFTGLVGLTNSLTLKTKGLFEFFKKFVAEIFQDKPTRVIIISFLILILIMLILFILIVWKYIKIYILKKYRGKVGT